MLHLRYAVLDVVREINLVLFQKWLRNIYLPEFADFLFRNSRFQRRLSLSVLLAFFVSCFCSSSLNLKECIESSAIGKPPYRYEQRLGQLRLNWSSYSQPRRLAFRRVSKLSRSDALLFWSRCSDISLTWPQLSQICTTSDTLRQRLYRSLQVRHRDMNQKPFCNEPATQWLRWHFCRTSPESVIAKLLSWSISWSVRTLEPRTLMTAIQMVCEAHSVPGRSVNASS